MFSTTPRRLLFLMLTILAAFMWNGKFNFFSLFGL